MSDHDHHDGRRQPPPRAGMHDLGRHRRALDHHRRRPRSLGTVDSALAAEPAGLTFLQISDSHVGFDKPANPECDRHAGGSHQQDQCDAGEAVVHDPHRRHHASVEGGRIRRRRTHHLAGQARRALRAGRARHHRRGGQALQASATATAPRAPAGIRSTPAACISSASSMSSNLKGGGLGNLGDEQLEWLEDDLKGRSKSTPIVVFAHIPLWTVYPQWGWGTEDGARALEYLKRFGSVTVLNGHIHQVMQKVEGNVTFHTARSTAFPQPAPGTAPSPGPMKVERRQAAQPARRRQHQLQAGQSTPCDHRYAAAGLRGHWQCIRSIAATSASPWSRPCSSLSALPAPKTQPRLRWPCTSTISCSSRPSSR